MKKQEYAEYLETKHWAKTRAAALKRADGKCQTCGGQRQLNVHHNTYDRLGKELPADLVVLCKSCHKLFHRRLQRGSEAKAKPACYFCKYPHLLYATYSNLPRGGAVVCNGCIKVYRSMRNSHT